MWGLDTPQDVSKTGCLSFRSIDACPIEYDIVSVQGDSLQLGLRSGDADICSAEKRPQELSLDALTRQAEE